MSNIGIAAQLFSQRAPATDDVAGMLRRCRDSGFDFVQWGAVPDMDAHAVCAHLGHAGLKAIAGHGRLEDVAGDFDSALAFWQTVGVPDLAVNTGAAACAADRVAWLEGAARLDTLGARFAKGGLRLSCHHRAFELEAFPGDTRPRLDLLFEAADDAHLCAVLDTGWIAAAGADPAAWIRRYAGRCPILHVKDLAAGRDAAGGPVFTPPGAGTLDWEAIFDAAEEAAVEWYVCELDACGADPFEAARTSYAFLAEHA